MSKTDISKKIPCSIPTVTKYTEKTINAKTNEMIGNKFGQLTVLSLAPKNDKIVSRCLRYVCQCDCGNIITVNGNSLRTGHTTSCGCSRKGVNIKDLTGQRFGFLTVKNLAYINDERRAVWNCQCDCGNNIQVTSHSLLGGHNISCGCAKQSLGEKRVEELLQQLNYNYAKEYRIPECRNIKPLPFDFAIFENNQLICLIEYQGDIHYKTSEGWNNEEQLKQRQLRDQIKRDYCQKHQIKLIEIPYTDYDILNENYLRKAIYD
jgi:hypothetical protein